MKHADLPSTVTIAGIRTRIRIVEEIDEVHTEGYYRQETAEILITRAAIKSGEAWPTLRHEMQHAALRLSGVAWSEHFEEEAVIRCLDAIFWPAWDRLQKRRNMTPRRKP